MSNAHYWVNKDDRAREAQSHTEAMAKSYGDEIQSAIDRSMIFRQVNRAVGVGFPEFIVTDNDTVSEIFAQDYRKAVALNFASYKNPGGGFLKGSSAQEESLCMHSYLYNILKEFPEFYEYNKAHLNQGMYTDAAIYTPGVLFFQGLGIKYCDVLTCASPNKSIANKYGGFTAEENSVALRKRVEFIRNILELVDVDVAILGAWGCGVFQQDASEVATLFKEAFSQTTLSKVVFAIPFSEHSRENYKAFADVFSK